MRWIWLMVGLCLAEPLWAFEKMVLIQGQGSVAPFYMDRYEVTQAEFLRFQKATIYKNLPDYPKHPLKQPDNPAMRVSWFEAQDFCHFHGKRLPTLAEWNLAAGAGTRKYPWGNEKPTGEHANLCDVNCQTTWQAPLLNDGHPKTADVGSFPKGQTPEGLHDMAGNVWEWTANAEDTGKPLAWKPKEQFTQEENNYHFIIKGGSFGSRLEQLESAAQAKAFGAERGMHLGFRCVKEATP